MGVWNKNDRSFMMKVVAGIIIFVLLLILVFWSGMKNMIGEYDALTEQSLSICAQEQVKELESNVRGVFDRLNALSAVLATDPTACEEDWFLQYISDLNAVNSLYTIQYISNETLNENITGSGQDTRMGIISRRLLSGKDVITDVKYDTPLAGYYFYIGVPVEVNGKDIIGALLANVKADMLLNISQPDNLKNYTQTYIIDEQGNIIFGVTSDNKGIIGDNIISEISKIGISDEYTEVIKDNLPDADGGSYEIPYKNRYVFLSQSSLSYNDWCIFNIVYSEALTIDFVEMRNTILDTAFLILIFSIVLFIIVLMLIRNKNNQILIEQSRYAMLSQFTDTIMFQYFYGKDSLEFSENALRVLALNSTIIKGLKSEKKELYFVDPEYLEIFYMILDQKLADKETLSEEIKLKTINGEYKWFRCMYQVLKDHKGKDISLTAKLSDISDYRTREHELMIKAETDVLTGVFNKTAEKRIDEALMSGSKGILFMIDIDNLKTINDSYGHAAGDKALKRMGMVLKETFRTGDIIMRIGGDEFAAFIHGSDSSELAEEKRIAIEKNLDFIELDNGEHLKISASIGYAFAPGNGKTYLDLIMVADLKMYELKHEKKVSKK